MIKYFHFMLFHSYFLLTYAVFTNWYFPRFEINIKPLRKLQCTYHLNRIPTISQSPGSIIYLLIVKLISSILLFSFNMSTLYQPSSRQTDQLGRRGRIFIQPINTLVLLATLKHLDFIGEYAFDLSLNGARLRHVRFSFKCDIWVNLLFLCW